MSSFGIYYQLGLEHITDPGAYDHMLFLLALSVIYRYSRWKRIAFLATAFTLGHSVTLALAVLDLIPVNTALIEFLIPVTIFATAAANAVQQLRGNGSPNALAAYAAALVFGLIHGMGFSSYLSAMLSGENLVVGLLGFNVGLEIGQLAILAVMLVMSFLVVGVAKLQHAKWSIGISVLAAIWAVYLMIETKPW